MKVLDYIRSTFSDEAVLDSIPVEAAANPGAYHAWRTYRAEHLRSQLPNSPESPNFDSTPPATGRASEGGTLGRNRRPGEWNWEGVWEERVKKAIKASLSEPVLFGGGTPGEDIVSNKHPGQLISLIDLRTDSFPRRRRRDRGQDEEEARMGNGKDC